VEIRNHRVHRLEAVPGQNEQSGFPAESPWLSVLAKRRRAFQCAYRGRSDRHHPPPGSSDSVHFRSRFRGKLAPLLVDLMRAGVRFRDGRECIQTNMQKDFRFLNTSSFQLREQLMGEMQARRRRGRGTRHLVINRLVTFRVHGGVMNVRRQRDMPGRSVILLNGFVETHHPLGPFQHRSYACPRSVFNADERAFAQALAPHQAFPAFLIHLAQQ